jgi:coatomer protein complex subunit gamma
LGFTITNTVAEVVLERVTVALQASIAGAYNHVCTIGVPRVREGTPGHVYVAYTRSPEAGFTAVTFSPEVRFFTREYDTETHEAVGDPVKETYPVDDCSVGPADYVASAQAGDFKSAWESPDLKDGEMQEQFVLAHRSVPEAVSDVLDTLGLTPQGDTGNVKPTATKHAVNLAGTFLGGTPVLGRLLISLEEQEGGAAGATCTLRIALRCSNKDICELLMSCLG